MYDVVTLGETMLRLTPPGLRRLEQAATFDIEVGGSESNTAIGLARLGLKVAWFSRLPDNGLGRLVERTVHSHGVDTGWLDWAKDERLGLYFLEEGVAPRGSSVIYDRANSAIAKVQPSDLPAALFRPDQARLLHLTGITPALSQNAAATCRQAVELAQKAGWLFSFDLNYRAKLWSPSEAQTGCDFFAQAANLLITPFRDARTIYELKQLSPEQVLEVLAKRYPQATLVLTLGKDGAIGYEPTTNQIYRQGVFPAGEVGRIGGGDAFAAGLLYGYLQTGKLAVALRWGAAVAALKYSTPGDLPVINFEEARQLVEQADSSAPSAGLIR